MKEKKFLRWFMIWSLVILGCFILACTVVRHRKSKELRETTFSLSNAENMGISADAKLDDFIFTMEPADLLSVKSMDWQGNSLYMTLEATGKGQGDVSMEVLSKESGELITYEMFYVRKDGWILDQSTGNFSNYRINHICIIVMVFAFALLLWVGYFKAQKELVFSYHSIFCIGLALWVSLIAVILVYDYINESFMINVYGTIMNAPDYFMLLTFPLVLVFAVSLMISNISLIRHERFRFTNVLGSLLAFVMLGGMLFYFLLNLIPISGSEFQVNLWSSFMAILSTAYAILECFLIGAIICGTRAALKKPVFDKDYIVILGCMIRKDGTLFPLLRGRVDRAIRFYKEQLEATGKKAIFVPSGGQGKNEIISEAEAMKRYLLEQGIEPEQIMIEDQSKNTRQNMDFSKKIIGENAKAVFSTTNYHVFRSGIISRQVGFEADGMGSHTKWYFWPNAYVRELIGMLSYKWKSIVLMFVPTVVFLVTVIFVFS
ncbi:MAG: YdcF family protein [Eubacteriales bacterium]|nr:YdcF family protein [Eubacteriales bacterium]